MGHLNIQNEEVNRINYVHAYFINYEEFSLLCALNMKVKAMKRLTGIRMN